MAEVTMPSATAAPTKAMDYTLDLTDLAGRDLHSWRLRDAPHMDAAEIGVFYHGDRINAVRESGWLKLTDGSGFVKEAHEGHLVWQLVQHSQSSSSASSPATTTPTSCAKKELSAASDEKSVSSASGSQSSALVMLQGYSPPTPYAGMGYTLDEPNKWFTGKSFRIGSAESEGGDGPQRFTGKSFKIGPAASEETSCDYEGSDSSISAPAQTISLAADRKRWADMEDSDDEGHSNRTEIIAADINIVLCLAAPEDCGKADESPLVQELEGLETSTVASTPRAEQAVRNQKRKQRNQALLRRKCKTQLCQHLTEKGSCPFGSDCWFAHSEAEIHQMPLEPESAVEVDEPPLPCVSDEQPSSEVVPSSEDAASRKPCRRRRNQALLQKKSKTELCRYLKEKGCCPFEGKCWFAHDIQELRA